MNRFIIALALLIICSGADAKIFQYVYIEANEGTASGGHVALQIEDEVFHYQYHDGLIRLNRDDSADFRFDYRYLQNRPLHVADIEIPAKHFTSLKDHFKREFWDQSRQFKHLKTLQNDSQLLEWLISRKSPTTSTPKQHNLQLSGAGLFYSPQDFSIESAKNTQCETQAAAQKILTALHSQIQQRYGSDFLMQRSRALKQAIRELDLPVARFGDIQKGYRFSERYLDLLNALLAVQAIQESHALSHHVCRALPATEWQLNANQINTLLSYQKYLRDSALTLINSKRPDWGQALFVALARIVVIQQSLDSGFWVFLDDFKPGAEIISPETYNNQAEVMHQQRDLAEQRWQQQWNALSQDHDLNDSRYTDLELAANRYHEWHIGLKTKSMRYQGQQRLPLQPLALPSMVMPDLNIQALQQRLQATQTAISALTAKLQTQYGYDLITRNCVTELSHSISLALTDAEHSPSSHIAPGSQFVPFLAFASLQSEYPVRQIHSLSSFRQQQLSQLYTNEFPPWVYLRESNVFSAELYHYNPDDAAFVFFTDDGLLFRPVFGAFNTVAGFGQSLLGLFAWPFDNGERLRNGSRGLLMSLPELVFINIRKGSYKFAVPAPTHSTPSIQSP